MKNKPNPDAAFALELLEQAIRNADDAMLSLEFDTAERWFRLASRYLSDARRANNDMRRWQGQAERL